MSIDIQGLPGGLVQNAGDSTQMGRTQEPAGVQQPQQNGQTDTVSITDSATRLRSLENTINALPVVDTQRVEDVQLQMATGSFSVNAESSADKMLEMERSLP